MSCVSSLEDLMTTSNHFDILVATKAEAVEWGVQEIQARSCKPS